MLDVSLPRRQVVKMDHEGHPLSGNDVHICKIPLPSIPKRCQLDLDEGACRMFQQSDVILLEKLICLADIVNCSIVLLKSPVITTQTRALSHEGCPLPHLHNASCCLMPLHNLKLHCSIDGKSTPDHDGAPFTVPHKKTSQVASPCHVSKGGSHQDEQS